MRIDFPENDKKTRYKIILEKINSLDSMLLSRRQNIEMPQNLPCSKEITTSNFDCIKGPNLKRKLGCSCTKQRCSNYKCGCLKKNLFCLNCSCKGCDNSLKSKETQGEQIGLIDPLLLRKKVIDFSILYLLYFYKSNISRKIQILQIEKNAV